MEKKNHTITADWLLEKLMAAETRIVTQFGGPGEKGIRVTGDGRLRVYRNEELIAEFSQLFIADAVEAYNNIIL